MPVVVRDVVMLLDGVELALCDKVELMVVVSVTLTVLVCVVEGDVCSQLWFPAIIPSITPFKACKEA